ncbi:MAG: L-threonylcarbamoyladenylate synthase [Firmicutes bacterium]|nr:L-threonylcarbamoyladenylate synthase [Bacillota bacterium]
MSNILSPTPHNIQLCANAIKNGEVVAFCTETVYGLGADAFSIDAVKKIFSLKGREEDNPLIVHISDISQVHELAREVPDRALKLMQKLMPGPISIVLKKSKKVPGIVTAGLDTVAIRMPRNASALELIKHSGIPIAAPSANISGTPSPTIAQHVENDFKNKLQFVLDGGQCEIGIESSVIDLSGSMPRILREGKVTKEEIEAVLGEKVEVLTNSNKPLSPGMKYKHYAPKAQVIFIEHGGYPILPVGLRGKKVKIISMKNCISTDEYAKNLFLNFRKADDEGYEVIVCELARDAGIGRAINNRIRKASSKM